MTRTVEAVGLLLGAVGILVLDVAGIDFPVIPPGVAILVVAAGLVAAVRARWSAGVGALAGAFILVGFVASGTGFDNLGGAYGVLGTLGQLVEVVGVAVALVAGLRLVVRRDHSVPA